jgi:primosomal protein N' (replication factor Y)
MEKVGSGTQKIEDEISEEFKDFRIFRLDQDTSKKKDASFNLIDDMSTGKIDILLGTQMVAKGFDFANVTVAGVLSADIGLHIPDFRATERIFSLLMQVSGRSGRGDFPGKVIIQTYDPENTVYKYLLEQDYFGFYKNESAARKAMNYPPFSRLARLLVRGEDEPEVEKAAGKLKTALCESIEKNKLNIILLGPSSAPITKIAKNFRHHIILKSKSIDDLRKVILESRTSVAGKGLYLEIDMDPYEML